MWKNCLQSAIVRSTKPSTISTSGLRYVYVSSVSLLFVLEKKTLISISVVDLIWEQLVLKFTYFSLTSQNQIFKIIFTLFGLYMGSFII